MSTATLSVGSRCPLGPHEVLDAYWFAQMLRCRFDRVALEARCTMALRRRIDSALGRAIGFIVDAADGVPEKADARLANAGAAILRALSFVDEMSVKRPVGEVVVADLRGHAGRLLERLKRLVGKPVETWSGSNYLPTVLEEVKSDTKGESGVDVVAAAAKLPDAAVRGLPPIVGAKHFTAYPPANGNGRASKLVAHPRKGKPSAGPPK